MSPYCTVIYQISVVHNVDMPILSNNCQIMPIKVKVSTALAKETTLSVVPMGLIDISTTDIYVIL